MVAASGAHHGGSGCQRLVGFDLGHGVGHGEHDGLVGHGADHILGDDVRRADAHEHIGALHGVGQLAAELFGIGDLRHFLLRRVHLLALAQNAEAIDHLEVLHAQVHQMTADGDARAAGAVDDHLGFADLLADHAQRVDQGRAHHHGGAVLVVVEHRDIADFLQLALDLEAAGSGDVFQVDAAEAAADQVNGADDFIHVLAADADREGVHVAERLEQRALAFHDGHAGFRADIAQAQHRGAVGDHGHQVVAAGEGEGFIVILLNLQTGLGDAGRISQGQIFLVLYGDAGNDLDLALPFAVQAQ